MSAIAMPVPGSQDTVRLPAHTGLMVLVVFGAIGFVLLGGWLLAYHTGDPRAWFAAVGIPFFGWGAVIGLRRVRSGWASTLSPSGITIPSPTFQPKLVRWQDIEKIATFKTGRSRFVGLQLKDVRNLISQYSPEEARQVVGRSRWLRPFLFFAGVAVPRDTDLADYFANMRKVWGAEIAISWADRDRDADSFANYLESWRSRYAGSNRNARDESDA